MYESACVNQNIKKYAIMAEEAGPKKHAGMVTYHEHIRMGS